MRNGPYELVIAPDDYPGMKYRDRYIYEHHLVWWQNTGETVVQPMLIHHKNERKRDNRFENLEKKHRSRHSADHNRQRPTKPDSDFICAWCEKTFQIKGKDVYTRTRYKNNHCSRSCSVTHQMQLAREARCSAVV